MVGTPSYGTEKPCAPGPVAPAYTPASYLVHDSFLTAPQLVSTFHDFHTSLEHISSAPALVFERLVAQLNTIFTAALGRERLANDKLKDENKALQSSNDRLKKELAELQASVSRCRCQRGIVAETEAGNNAPLPRRWSIASLLFTWRGNSSTCSDEPAERPPAVSGASPPRMGDSGTSETRPPEMDNSVITTFQARPSNQQPKPKNNTVIATFQAQPSTQQPKLKPKPKIDNPFISTFHTSQVRSASNPTTQTSRIIGFNKPYSTPPGLLVGLSELDLGCTSNVRVKAYASDVQKHRFRINVDSWMETKLYCGGCAWLQIDSADPDFQFGEYKTLEDNPHYEWRTHYSRYITFPRAYSSPPQVAVCFSMLDMNHDTHWHVKTYATNITTTGFTVHIETWDGSRLFAGAAAWIACPADKPDVCSGTINTCDVRSWRNPQTRTSGRVGFKPLARAPRVFVAINSLDIDCRHNLRLKVGASSVDAGGMNWYIDAWYDTVVYSAGASYIAMV